VAADAATADARVTALAPRPAVDRRHRTRRPAPVTTPLALLLDRAAVTSGVAAARVRELAAAGSARWPDSALAVPSDASARALYERLHAVVVAHRYLAHRVSLLTVAVAEEDRRFLLAGLDRSIEHLRRLVDAAVAPADPPPPGPPPPGPPPPGRPPPGRTAPGPDG